MQPDYMMRGNGTGLEWPPLGCTTHKYSEAGKQPSRVHRTQYTNACGTPQAWNCSKRITLAIPTTHLDDEHTSQKPQRVREIVPCSPADFTPWTQVVLM